MAWAKHNHRNKHHWTYWLAVNGDGTIDPLPMPEKYVRQMLCDWRGMSRKFGDTPKEYYENNRQKMLLHPETLVLLRKYLGE